MASATTIEAFNERSESLGVRVRRVEPGAATDALAALSEPPTVASQLPWDDDTLPDAATTDPTPAELEAAATGITHADAAIAEYGSLVLPATGDGLEPVSLFPERHVAVLRESDVVPDMATAIDELGPRLRATGTSAVLASGPSATADMGDLVVGAHGPAEVHVVLLEDE